MKTRNLEYTNGKTKFIGYLALDEKAGGRRPGVVVFPEAFGLNDHARERAERLAQLGYVALAADLHGGGMVIDDMPKLGPAMQALYSDRDEWRARARAALDALLAQPQVDGQRIAAIGFCFGGTTALELMRSGAPLAAVATFHSGLLPELPEDAGALVPDCSCAMAPKIRWSRRKPSMRSWPNCGATKSTGSSSITAMRRTALPIPKRTSERFRAWRMIKTRTRVPGPPCAIFLTRRSPESRRSGRWRREGCFTEDCRVHACDRKRACTDFKVIQTTFIGLIYVAYDALPIDNNVDA